MDDIINLQYATLQTPLPDFIWEEIKEYSKYANVYHPQPQELVKKLAERHSVSKEMIYLTAGCDETIQMNLLTFGKNTVIFTPTYNVYRDAEVFGGKLSQIWSLGEQGYQIHPQNYPDATLIILANPNNPTGYSEKEKVIELIKKNPQVMILIDEAYSRFADVSVIDLVFQYPNLVVGRSFSKDFSMAGNRIGYLVAQPEIIFKLKNKAQWQSMSYLSVGAALSALNHEEYFRKSVEEIIKSREDFNSFLKENGITIFTSKINVVLTKFASEAEGTDFANYLKQKGIITSHGNGNSNIGLDLSYVRIAIGTVEQMQKVKKIISEWRLTEKG